MKNGPTISRSWKRVLTGALTCGVLLVGGPVTNASAQSHFQSSGHQASPQASSALCGSLTVWTDATRVPAVNDYAKAHPCVHLTTTVFGYTNGELQTKLGLFNKEGSGWPEVLWDPTTTDAGFLDSPRYNYAVPLNNGLVPQSLIDQWAYNSLSACTYGGKIYCLRNDIGANVLWYNAPLMKQFGYAVPTTWAQYAAIGKEVAAQHPGYVIGTIGDGYAEDIYFWGSGCPSNDLVGTNKVEVDTTAPDCTRVSNMVDPLIKDGSISTLAIFSSDFAKKYGDNNHLLMVVGPTWYGEYVMGADFKPAKHTWGVADPLSWPGFDYTGDVGGGIWQVSSHATAAQQKLGASMVEWVTTAPAYQATAPTYPANKGAAKIWLSTVNSSGLFANDPTKVFETSAQEIWPGSSALLFSTDTVWADTVVTGLVAGKTLGSLLKPWGTAISEMAQTFGYQVVNS
jgi:ABC-type glycerol-3-phosphate transport system substrate-binding protein